MFDRVVGFQAIDAADQFVECAEAELRHDLACFLGDHEQIVHDVFRLAVELVAQHFVLRRNADGAGVQVTLAHHDATEHDQGRCAESHFLGTQQRADHDVTAGFHLAVGLHNDTAAQVVHHERLVRFGQAEFPRQTRVFDAGQR